MRIAVLTALTLLVAAPVALADPPWSAPRVASPAAALVSAPGLAFASDGSGLMSWNAGQPGPRPPRDAAARRDVVQRRPLGGEVVAKPLGTGAAPHRGPRPQAARRPSSSARSTS